MGLLETLRRKVGCMHLSDLHDPKLLPLIQYHLRRIPPACYSLWEWKDAAEYLTAACPFDTAEEGKRYLIEWKRKGEEGNPYEDKKTK